MNKETMIRDIIRNVMYGSRSALEHRETEIARIARCVQDGKMSVKDSIDRTADTMNTYKTVIKNLSDTATWKLLQIVDGKPIDGIKVEGHTGKWYVVDVVNTVKAGKVKTLLLLEHETYGDETAALITDTDFNIVMDDVWNGFEDYWEAFPEG